MNDDEPIRSALRRLDEPLDPELVQLAAVERRITVRRRRRVAAVILGAGVVVVALVAVAIGGAADRPGPDEVVVPATAPTTAPAPVAATPSGTLIAVADRRLFAVDAVRNIRRAVPVAGAVVEAVGPTLDGSAVVALDVQRSCPGSREVEQIWPSDPTRAPRRLLGFGDHIVASPDGRVIGYHATECGFDVGINWTELDGGNFRATGASIAYVPLTWSPDSSRLLVAKGNDVRWIRREHIGSTLDPAPGLTPGPYAAIARTGELITARNGEVVTVDPDTGKLLRRLFRMRYGPVLQIAVDPSGTRVAVLVDARSVHGDRGFGELFVWDAATGELSEMAAGYDDIAWLNAGGTSP